MFYLKTQKKEIECISFNTLTTKARRFQIIDKMSLIENISAYGYSCTSEK